MSSYMFLISLLLLFCQNVSCVNIESVSSNFPARVSLDINNGLQSYMRSVTINYDIEDPRANSETGDQGDQGTETGSGGEGADTGYIYFAIGDFVKDVHVDGDRTGSFCVDVDVQDNQLNVTSDLARIKVVRISYNTSSTRCPTRSEGLTEISAHILDRTWAGTRDNVKIQLFGGSSGWCLTATLRNAHWLSHHHSWHRGTQEVFRSSAGADMGSCSAFVLPSSAHTVSFKVLAGAGNLFWHYDELCLDRLEVVVAGRRYRWDNSRGSCWEGGRGPVETASLQL